MKNKFDIVYEQIMSQLKQNVKYFDTYQEARDFLNKNFNGHGAIYSNDDKILETCRCMTGIHQSMGIPKVVANISKQEYYDQQREKYKDYPIISGMF